MEQTPSGANLLKIKTLFGFPKIRKPKERTDNFATWIRDRISKYEFVENTDYIMLPKTGELENKGLQGKIEYFVTLDMAKQLAMVENNEKGMQVRKYFIECEKKLTQPKPMTQIELIAVRLPSCATNAMIMLWLIFAKCLMSLIFTLLIFQERSSHLFGQHEPNLEYGKLSLPKVGETPYTHEQNGQTLTADDQYDEQLYGLTRRSR